MRPLNLILAPMQVVATAVAFGMGTTFDEVTASPAGDPPIIPAGYAVPHLVGDLCRLGMLRDLPIWPEPA